MGEDNENKENSKEFIIDDSLAEINLEPSHVEEPIPVEEAKFTTEEAKLREHTLQDEDQVVNDDVVWEHAVLPAHEAFDRLEDDETPIQPKPIEEYEVKEPRRIIQEEAEVEESEDEAIETIAVEETSVTAQDNEEVQEEVLLPEVYDTPSVEVEPNYRKTLVTVLSIMFVGLLIFALSGFFIFKLISDKNDSPVVDVVKNNPSETIQANDDSIEQGRKSLLRDLWKDAPEATTGRLTTSVTPNIIKVNSGHKVFIENSKLVALENDCSVINREDFCLAATGVLAGKNIEVYFFKNIVDSRILENPKKFTPVNVKGSLASGEFVLNLNDPYIESKVFAMAADDSSGWLITGDLNYPQLASSFRVD